MVSCGLFVVLVLWWRVFFLLEEIHLVRLRLVGSIVFFADLLICLLICWCIYLSMYICVYLLIYLLIYLFIYVSMYSFVYLLLFIVVD